MFHTLISRQKNESIVINECKYIAFNDDIPISDVTIVVVDIRGDRVRLGVKGPKIVHERYRQELYEATQRQRLRSHELEDNSGELEFTQDKWIVLSRKKDECLVINSDIRIYVADICREEVSLTIICHSSPEVYRGEEYDDLRRKLDDNFSEMIDQLDAKELSEDEIDRLSHVSDVDMQRVIHLAT